MSDKYKISVVIPVYDEAGSLQQLIERLIPVLNTFGRYEIIFVNDGSRDASGRILDEIQKANPSIVRVIHLRTNFGKSIALQLGFNEVRGEYVVMIDADLQDQPEEIPKLIDAMEQNKLDAVTGWKINRQDSVLKTLPSRYFNLLVNWMSGLKIHDFNCGLKAFRRECLESFNLYGQLHRFILIFIARFGFKVGEVPVAHAPRMFGVSKYGFKRLYHGFMDIMTVFFITRYLGSPLYFFGFYALFSILIGSVIGFFFMGMHFMSFFVHDSKLHLAEHPLWLLSPILILIGIIMFFFGLIGELITFYLTSQSTYNPAVHRHVDSISQKQ